MSVAPNTRSAQTVKADLAQRRAAAEKRAKAQMDVLRAEMVLRRCRDTADALERLQMRTPLTFATLADLMAPQPWAIAEGVVLGHLLTMVESAYQNALDGDGFDALTLDEALSMPWDDRDELYAWTRIYTETLRSLADRAEATTRSFYDQDALRKATRPAAGGDGASDDGSGKRGGL